MATLYHVQQLSLFPARVCPTCGKEKLLSEFARIRNGKEYYPANCRDCASRIVGRFEVPENATTICTDCQIEKPRSAFSKGKNQCKECIYKYRLARAQIITDGSKFCTGCSTEKAIQDFSPDVSMPDGHRSRCIKCSNAQDRKQRPVWRKNNPEKARLKNQKDHERNREHRNAYDREWYKNHPEAGMQAIARRRARMYQVEFEEIDYDLVIKRSSNWCYICQKPILQGQKTHFDHVIPLARHGRHVTDNLALTHRICNLRKHDLLLSEMTAFQRRGP